MTVAAARRADSLCTCIPQTPPLLQVCAPRDGGRGEGPHQCASGFSAAARAGGGCAPPPRAQRHPACSHGARRKSTRAAPRQKGPRAGTRAHAAGLARIAWHHLCKCATPGLSSSSSLLLPPRTPSSSMSSTAPPPARPPRRKLSATSPPPARTATRARGGAASPRGTHQALLRPPLGVRLDL